MTDECEIYAFVSDGHIEDLRSISPEFAVTLNGVAVEGQWVPLSRLQGHPDMIYFCGESFRIVSNSCETFLLRG